MLIYLSMIESRQDKDKFEYIYKNYKTIMFYEARHILKDEHLAEDAVHEAFLKIIKIISKIRIENCNQLKRFLVLIVRNKAIDMIRKNNKGDNIPFEDISNTKDDLQEDILEKIISVQGAELLVNIISQLDDIYKIPMELKVIYGYSHEEIADILDISVNLVKVRIHRAKQQVKKIISKELGDETN